MNADRTTTASGDAPGRPGPAARGGLLRANLVVASGTAMSRATGFARLVALSYALGQGVLTGAYNLANNSPNIVYELILGGVLTATLVPTFTAHLVRADRAATDAVVSTALLTLAALTLVAVAAAPWIVQLYTVIQPDAAAERFGDLAVPLARLFLPQIFFYGATAVLSALLNAHERFAPAAWAPVLNNVVVIGILVATPQLFDGRIATIEAGGSASSGLTWWLGIGTTAGIVVMTLALLPALRRAGIHLRWRPSWRHREVRRVLRASTWTAGYVIGNQIALFVVIALALDAEGATGYAAYLAAFTFFQLPHGLLAVSLMTTLGPQLARAAQAGDRRQLRSRTGMGVRLVVLAVAPAAAALVALADPLVALLRIGAFDTDDVARTAPVLAAFAWGLVGFSVYLFVLRAFYAMGDTRTPYMLNVVENGLNIVAAGVLVQDHGVRGLAFAYALAYTVSAPAALVVLARRVGGFALGVLALRCLRPLLAAAAGGLVAAAAFGSAVEGWTANLLRVAAGGIVVVAVATTVLVLAAPVEDRAVALRRGR